MFDRILIATDGSSESMVAVKLGVDLAKATGSKVLGLYVVNEVVVASAVRQLGADKHDIEASLHASGEKAVDAIKKMADESGVDVETKIASGVPACAIVDLAKIERVDMIVMGSHGESGVMKSIIGSVVHKVLNCATCPVLVVR